MWWEAAALAAASIAPGDKQLLQVKSLVLSCSRLVSVDLVGLRGLPRGCQVPIFALFWPYVSYIFGTAGCQKRSCSARVVALNIYLRDCLYIYICKR
jgi:hypothetical protein